VPTTNRPSVCTKISHDSIEDIARIIGEPHIGPEVLLTDYSTEIERNEQRGVAVLAECIRAVFRNPRPRARLAGEASEQDVLGNLWMIHRLDGARGASP